MTEFRCSTSVRLIQSPTFQTCHQHTLRLNFGRLKTAFKSVHQWSLISSKIKIWAPNAIDQKVAPKMEFLKKKEIDIFISDNWLPIYSNTNTNGYSSIRRILIGYLIGLINVFIYLKWAIISGMWNRFIPERTRLSTVWMHRPKREWPHVT